MSLFGSLSGLVKNAESGLPCSGVRVTLSPSGLSVLTGNDGMFSLSNLDPADYTVSFAADGYEFVKWQIDGQDVLDGSGDIVSADVYKLTIPEGTGSRVTIRGCFKLVD